MERKNNTERSNKSKTTKSRESTKEVIIPNEPLTKGAKARIELHTLTAALKELHPNVGTNRLLIDYYKSQGATELRTYDEWRERGMQVKKGAKAYTIWGKSQPSTAREGALFFPVKYVFDITQTVSKTKA